MSAPGSNIERLVEIMARLRAPDGCPWDREQTHTTLKPFLLEEAYELLEAIDSGSDRELIGELGDVLLQVIFHARIAAEEKRFTIDDVAAAIADKLVRRHPHVFGSTEVEDADEVVTNWERIKRSEREGIREHPVSALEGVPAELPALLRAQRIQEKASKTGFDWEHAGGALDKVAEEFEELRRELAAREKASGAVRTKGVPGERSPGAVEPISAGGEDNRVEEELGDLLFALVNTARFLRLCPEEALRRAVAKFERRFRAVEERFRAAGCELEDASLEEMDRVWEEVKESEV